MTITITQILFGLKMGYIKIIDSPHDDGAVCQIGAHWFYFGGQTAESMSAEEYLANVPNTDIAMEIYEVLKDFSRDETYADEYMYYAAYLREQEREAKANLVQNATTRYYDIAGGDKGGIVIDADTILVDMADGNTFGLDDINGLGVEVLNIWTQSRDKTSVEALFEHLTGIPFSEYAYQCSHETKIVDAGGGET